MPAPHLDLPFRVEGGRVATTVENTPQEIRNCVVSCLRTRLGSRVDAPAYGIPNELFARQPRSPDAGPYLRAVEATEPRAALLGSAEIEGLVRRIVFKEGAGA